MKPLRVPCVGDVAIANLSVSAGVSASVPVSVILVAVLYATVTDCAVAVGVPTATVNDTVAGALVFTPLLTVNVKLSAPW